MCIKYLNQCFVYAKGKCLLEVILLFCKIENNFLVISHEKGKHGLRIDGK